MDLDLRDKVVFVAGSSRGIGLACASAFHAEGACVVVTGRATSTTSAAARVVGRLDPGRVLAFGGDLSDEATIAEALAATVAHYGRLDVVVGCIGDGRGRLGWNQGADAWTVTFEQNLWPAVRLCEAAITHLARGEHPAIVLIGSITGRERLGPLPYGTAKAALAAYATRLASDVAPLGIRVLCVEPGNIAVEGGRWMERLDEDRDGVTAMLAAEVPQQRLGAPREVADVVCFVASPRASFMTATRVVVDGGQTRD